MSAFIKHNKYYSITFPKALLDNVSWKRGDVLCFYHSSSFIIIQRLLTSMEVDELRKKDEFKIDKRYCRFISIIGGRSKSQGIKTTPLVLLNNLKLKHKLPIYFLPAKEVFSDDNSVLASLDEECFNRLIEEKELPEKIEKYTPEHIRLMLDEYRKPSEERKPPFDRYPRRFRTFKHSLGVTDKNSQHTKGMASAVNAAETKISISNIKQQIKEAKRNIIYEKERIKFYERELRKVKKYGLRPFKEYESKPKKDFKGNKKQNGGMDAEDANE
jgi:bifunctional DNA-binding transcriptional regulator/antitoxin component of YhaV-PrlF toxin-antitoxin module